MKYTEELRRRQRAGLLSQISTTDRLIRQIYIRAAARLEKQAEGAKDESLTRRWQEDYSRSVRREIDRMNREIEAAVTSGLDRSARIRADGAAEYLERAAGMAGLRLSDSFTDVLSHCRTDALEALIGGRMYTDGRILSQRIWSAAGRLQGGIEEIIAQGIAQQQSTYQIARALEAYVNPKAACPVDWRSLYPDTPFEMKVDYNATRLARTAINHAYWQTGINAAEANPFCKAMHWELSDAHYERQVAHWGEDECDIYARHDEGLGRGNFPIGKLPRPHPNCLCIQYEVLPEPEEAAARFRAWMDGAKDDELEQGFAQFVQKESTRQHSESLHLKQPAHSTRPPRMPQKALERYLSRLKKERIQVYQSEEVDRYLDYMGAEAMITDDASGVYFRTDGPSASAAWEEYIHIHQSRERGVLSGYGGMEQRREHLMREIEAQKMLLRDVEKYGITDTEVREIQANLEKYERAWKEGGFDG